DRAGYVAVRFWDGLDFENDPRAVDSAFVERSFANFGAMLAVARDEDVTEAIDRLLGRARANRTAAALVAAMADKYLGEGESPVFDEDVYLAFLNRYKAVAGGGDALDEKIVLASRNAPGVGVADFGMVMRDGRRSTLRAELGGGECLVMFYDSDCEHCREAMTDVVMSPLSDRMKVVAVDVAGDREKWESANVTMPEAWAVGFATEDVEESDKYFFRRMPTIYVVDGGRVVSRSPRL
ncbi:MAG: DUF5106 domain-containing protein, partial [Muribaculaceae bacterium]|nr:DUF5106 domain-containing protein [Muribaculaceae bacterium]